VVGARNVVALFRLLLDIILAFLAPRAALVAENLLLRQQLIVVRRQVKRPLWRGFDRWLIGTLAGRFQRLLDAVLLVKPETVIRWHRTAWRLLWRWRSRRPPGRPPVDADLRELIRRMWRENPTWGQKIIAAQLARLGYQVSPRTVAKYRPSDLDTQRGQRWTTFIRNHLHETWACDFFVLVTGRFRVLYVFVLLSLDRRKIVHAGVTEHPSARWAAQRFVEAAADARQIPRFLVHDRDSIYGADFRRRVRGLGTRLLATPPRSPKANAFGERVIGTLRRDCFDHIIVKNQQHAERVLHDYLAYYHGRPHRGLRMQPPDGARHLPPPRPPIRTRIAGIPILGGLHHRYGFAIPARTPPSEIDRAA
jgi:putative transposase